jgi:hypothetical protein
MRGAVPPLHQYAFMAWCSVKAQGQLYLYLHNLNLRISLPNIMYRKKEIQKERGNEKMEM